MVGVAGANERSSALPRAKGPLAHREGLPHERVLPRDPSVVQARSALLLRARGLPEEPCAGSGVRSMTVCRPPVFCDPFRLLVCDGWYHGPALTRLCWPWKVSECGQHRRCSRKRSERARQLDRRRFGCRAGIEVCMPLKEAPQRPRRAPRARGAPPSRRSAHPPWAPWHGPATTPATRPVVPSWGLVAPPRRALSGRAGTRGPTGPAGPQWAPYARGPGLRWEPRRSSRCARQAARPGAVADLHRGSVAGVPPGQGDARAPGAGVGPQALWRNPGIRPRFATGEKRGLRPRHGRRRAGPQGFFRGTEEKRPGTEESRRRDTGGG